MRALYDSYFVSMENFEITIISMKDMQPASTGDVTHEDAIQSNSEKLSCEAPTVTQPAPISAPITACVPEMGIPNLTATAMKTKVEKHTDVIIISYVNAL